MKNSFGNAFTATIFGESHGPAVGIILDGITPGIEVDTKKIKEMLARRRPALSCETKRREDDEFSILSGVFNGKTTGTPLCITIPNKNTDSSAYDYGKARPSHADYAAYEKYHGFEDYRGGGHFSGRITAALAAAGGILLPALEKLGITISTHISCCADISDREFEDIASDSLMLKNKVMPVLSEEAEKKMLEAISLAAEKGDSLGGATQTVISGLEPGLGEPFFDSAESMISHILFGIGGIKGVEFGSGFDGCKLSGSKFNDPFITDNGKIITSSNNNGGINGGITNGMPVFFRCAVKPTPSIRIPQKTVDFINGTEEEITVCGRHDPAIIRRICPVIDSAAAIAVCDMLAMRYGNDFLLKGKE